MAFSIMERFEYVCFLSFSFSHFLYRILFFFDHILALKTTCIFIQCSIVLMFLHFCHFVTVKSTAKLLAYNFSPFSLRASLYGSVSLGVDYRYNTQPFSFSFSLVNCMFPESAFCCCCLFPHAFI